MKQTNEDQEEEGVVKEENDKTTTEEVGDEMDSDDGKTKAGVDEETIEDHAAEVNENEESQLSLED